MKRKIITLEVETEYTNEGIKNLFKKYFYAGGDFEFNIIQIQVNQITQPKKGKKK